MTEPDVVITDYLLTLESLTFAILLYGQTDRGAGVQSPLIFFFIMTGVASWLGGTVHGFFVTDPGVLGRWLWKMVLLALGLAASSIWLTAAHLMLQPDTEQIVFLAVAVEWLVYALIVVFITDAFWIAVVNYLPATLFLIAAFALEYRANPQSAMRLGLIGLGLTLVAAVIQRLKIALHRTYFNHNALYHLVQGVALFLIFVSARFLVGG